MNNNTATAVVAVAVVTGTVFVAWLALKKI
jgi:hypothetical protein